MIIFSIFSRRCCQSPQESHANDRNICSQLAIRGFLPIQHLDKFIFLNFDLTSVFAKYGKTLISDPVIYFFFKGRLLFCTKREHLNHGLLFHSNRFFCIGLKFFSDVSWFVKLPHEFLSSSLSLGNICSLEKLSTSPLPCVWTEAKSSSSLTDPSTVCVESNGSHSNSEKQFARS